MVRVKLSFKSLEEGNKSKRQSPGEKQCDPLPVNFEIVNDL